VSLATRRLSWALALSLGLNLFLVGFGVMRWMEQRDAQHSRRARREKAEALLGAPTEEMIAQRGKIAATRKRVVDMLSAEQFSQDRAFNALAELRTVISVAQELLHEQIVHRFPNISLEQRRQFAEEHFARSHRED
jgi:hypothetical protein